VVDDKLWPPVEEIEVGVKAFENRDTDLAIRTRAGIALMLARVRQAHTVEPVRSPN